MASDRTLTRRLQLALLSAVVATGANPFLVQWAYQDWNALLVVLAIAPVLPLMAFAGLTLWQEAQGRAATTFAARPLSSALFLMSVWVVGTAIVGYFVLLLGLVVLPVSASLLALAWVQPRPDREALTVILGIAAVPFVIWFAGRADEYVSEAFISGSALVAIVAVMYSVRRTVKGQQDLPVGGRWFCPLVAIRVAH